MRVDMHAHYVPPRILEALERDAVPYGVQVQHAEGGGRCLHFGAGVTLRPFHPHLLDLDARWRFMENQRVDRQILSVWTDLSGYGLEPAAPRAGIGCSTKRLPRWCSSTRSAWPRSLRCLYKIRPGPQRNWPIVCVSAVLLEA